MTSTANQIAVIEGADSDRIQQLLADTASSWRSRSIRVTGLTAIARQTPGQVCRAGVLCDVDTGKRYSIYLDEAPPGKTCHVDANGVEAACAAILEGIANSELVVLSKFGKLEAAGKGLFPAFQAAIAAGKPLLTSVSYRHRDAWQRLVPSSVHLSASIHTLNLWWQAQVHS